jgi:hypothetical protein
VSEPSARGSACGRLQPQFEVIPHAAMRIRLSDPSLVDDLLMFLRERQCVVEPASEDTLDVELPAAMRSDAAALELQLYLRVWEATHPGARAEPL